MADFRTKLITVAGMATVFAGMAFGQATVNGTTGVAANAVFLRAEGTTELVANSTVTVNQGAAVATVNLTVYVSPALTITSQVTGAGKVSETTATPAGGAAVNGTVSGSTVTFTGLTVPAGAGTTVITISGIRVNASTIAAPTGVPTGVAETFFVGGTNITPIVPNPVTVGYALNGLGAIKAAGQTNNLICAGSAVTLTNYTVAVSEGFATSFRTLADEVGGVAATNGTRLTVSFGNVPANTAVYVPLTVAASAGVGTITAISSATAATAVGNNAADAKVTGELVPLAAVTIANNAGTAYYEVTADSLGTVDTFTIPVILVNAAGSLTAPATAITTTVSFAPIGSATSYPSFVSGNSTATVNGSTFGACTTTLLFPYVTNASGFETGLAIANTSFDALGAKGASSVATQSGTCVLSFYGNATASSNPANATTASIAAGTTFAGTLTSVAGSNFTGYLIANCNFQFAHAFSYIVYNFGQSSGTAMGYLAEVIPGARGAAEALNN